MKFEVYNLNGALNRIEKGGNWISIRDLYCDDLTKEKYSALDRRITRGGANALTLYFDDIDPYRFKYGMEHYSIKQKFADGQLTPIFFNPEIAKQIVDWVMKIWNEDHNDTIKVHCWAGRSRSQAVAYWLNMYFNLILDRNIQDYTMNNARNVHEKVHFNCEVLMVFTSVFG